MVHLTSQAFAPSSHPGVFRMVRGLAGRGTQVVLCTKRPGYADVPLTGPQREALANEGIFVHAIELVTLRKAFPPRQLLAAIRGAYGRPRAIVAHLGKNAFRGLALGAVADAPVLGVFHGEDANLEIRDPRYRERFERWFASPGAVALGVAEHLTGKLVAAGFPPERAFTHHLGLDPADHRPKPAYEGQGPLRFALSGRLMKVKGHEVAIQALALARREIPGSELHLYGEGPLEGPLRDKVRELGLEEAVCFHGIVPVEVLREELEACDALLQPSEADGEGREEGVPNSILEAMAMGLPVVATRHGGIPEAVIEGKTGRLVPEHAVQELAAAMVELADPKLRERFGLAGRARIEVDYDQARQGEALAERVEAAGRGYASIPRSERKVAWRRALEGYAELPEAIGRRERLRWPLRLLISAWRGELP
ncbi:MAG: colanic acid biosynthesis glycosyltransferase WcaL [bacterium]|nr:colanic acid biosynthesis glycosyltransferase WcaL [bacterium]